MNTPLSFVNVSSATPHAITSGQGARKCCHFPHVQDRLLKSTRYSRPLPDISIYRVCTKYLRQVCIGYVSCIWDKYLGYVCTHVLAVLCLHSKNFCAARLFGCTFHSIRLCLRQSGFGIRRECFMLPGDLSLLHVLHPPNKGHNELVEEM